MEFVEAEEVVESSGISTTSQVWRVASGAKDTRRLATRSQLQVSGTIAHHIQKADMSSSDSVGAADLT